MSDGLVVKSKVFMRMVWIADSLWEKREGAEICWKRPTVWWLVKTQDEILLYIILMFFSVIVDDDFTVEEIVVGLWFDEKSVVGLVVYFVLDDVWDGFV